MYLILISRIFFFAWIWLYLFEACIIFIYLSKPSSRTKLPAPAVQDLS